MSGFFCFILIMKGIDVLKSKSPCIMLNKNINFNKNEMRSSMENCTHSCREMNLVLQLIYESQINIKTDELELMKEKRGHFSYCLFFPKDMCVTFVFYLNQACGFSCFYQNSGLWKLFWQKSISEIYVKTRRKSGGT